MTAAMRFLVGLAPWIIIAMIGLPVILPADWWMRVEAVRVADVDEGQTPQMVVIRTIRRDFTADWVATVRRVEAGGSVAVCVARGRSDYRTTSVLPAPPKLTLAWWLNGGACALEPGAYVMTTKWSIDTVSPLDKIVTAVSNVFTVRPSPP
mgnify:FL=1|jgi:hypothetical protein